MHLHDQTRAATGIDLLDLIADFGGSDFVASVKNQPKPHDMVPPAEAILLAELNKLIVLFFRKALYGYYKAPLHCSIFSAVVAGAEITF